MARASQVLNVARVRDLRRHRSDSHTITIIEPEPPCPESLTGTAINGPIAGTHDSVYLFTGIIKPAHATEPITYTWSPEP